MAFRFITYSTTTGEIFGRYWATSPEAAALYSNTLIIGSDVSTAVWDQQPEVTMHVVNDVLVDKDAVAFTATSTLFGVGSETVITVTGLGSYAIMRIGTQTASVSPADNQITFSSDVQGSFKVRFQNNRYHYSYDQITLTVS